MSTLISFWLVFLAGIFFSSLFLYFFMLQEAGATPKQAKCELIRACPNILNVVISLLVDINVGNKQFVSEEMWGLLVEMFLKFHFL